jgi:hypothetical protein
MASPHNRGRIGGMRPRVIAPQQDVHSSVSPRRLFTATKNQGTFQFFREMNPIELAEAGTIKVAQQVKVHHLWL